MANGHLKPTKNERNNPDNVRIKDWGNSAAYKLQPQRWGQRWDVWCKERLGNSQQHLARIEEIAKNFTHDVCNIYDLPADQQSLYALARLKRDAPEAFNAAIEDGAIAAGWHSWMSGIGLCRTR